MNFSENFLNLCYNDHISILDNDHYTHSMAANFQKMSLILYNADLCRVTIKSYFITDQSLSQ